MPIVTVERTHLELRTPAPVAESVAVSADVSITEELPCSVSLYRQLYGDVGRAHYWIDRLAWSDAQLADYLARDTVRIWVLRDATGVGGYFELVRHDDESVEIAYFGLLASHHGRGLGRLLLTRAIEEGWGWGASRLTVHTCTLDGPAALPNYIARGFEPFLREQYEQQIPTE